MHHKRRSRRRDKRVMAPCGCCEVFASPARRPPVESEICNGKSRSKRKRPKKERCPVNGKHEWYYEWITQTTPLYVYYRDWNWTPRREYNYRIKKATCIHCWTQKRVKTRDENAHPWRSRPRKLPKRKVNLN